MNTKFKTNIRGEYEGETTFPLGNATPTRKMELRLNTHKTSGRRLVTMATAVEPTAYGFSFVVFEDFNKVVLNTSPSRITKKLIEAQHAEALTHIDDIILAAQMHYDIEPALA